MSRLRNSPDGFGEPARDESELSELSKSRVISGRPLDVVPTKGAKVAGSSNRAKLVASIANYGRGSRPAVGFRCPFCQSNLAPKVKRKISTAGWVTFTSLLIFCFPLCIIGLFIKDEYRVCRSCGIKLD